MRKYLLLALAFTLVAVPAFASVQNVKVGGSIESTYIDRRNFALGSPGNEELEQSAFITQAIVQIGADLTDNVSTTVALINERPWGEFSSSSTDVDLLLAFAELREFLYAPLTLIAGRQDFRFGNSAVFDSAGTNNTAPGDSNLLGVANDLTKQTTLDAVRAILDFNPLTITTFAALVADNTNGLTDDDDDKNVFGANATYELGDSMNSVVEAYLFFQNDRSTADSFAGIGDKSDDIKVPGLRLSTNPLEGLNLQGEFAMQHGNKAIASGVNKRRKAYLTQAIVNYQVPAADKYNPVVHYSFTKVTGDDANPSSANTDDEWTGWDPFFESQGSGTIYNAIFDFTDMIINTVALSMNPMEDVTTKLSYHKLWREKKLAADDVIDLKDPSSASNGSFSNEASILDKRQLGQEFDFKTTYAYTEDVQFGLLLGWFFPGEAFHSNTMETAKQALVNLNVAF